MSDDRERLIGGYAYDLLGAGDEQRLLRSALEDQTLFDELASEEQLRNLLADPESRAQVLDELRQPARVWVPPWHQRSCSIGWGTPAILAATLVLVVGVAWQLRNLGPVDPASPLPLGPAPPPGHLSRSFEVSPPIAGDLRLVLRVTDTGGAPLAGAAVLVEKASGAIAVRLRASTDDRGLFDSEQPVPGLQPGSYRAVASKDGYWIFDGTIEVKEGVEPGLAVLSFQLWPAPTVPD